MNHSPLILVTNDDGMFAPGIKALVEVASEFGEVLVVAPNSPQSGKGHAVTLTEPLRLNKVDVFSGIPAYECSGTPVDCVKIAKYLILKNRTVDLCVSGINHGSNASINIIYSGTMSAAMETSIEGIPSVGFSLMDFSFEADFSLSKIVARAIIGKILKESLIGTSLLNVNIPGIPPSECKGLRVCRQAEGRWIESFQEAEDPRGQKYYWLTGEFIAQEPLEGSDIKALEDSYVSIVPSHHDLTLYPAIEKNKHFESIIL